MESSTGLYAPYDSGAPPGITDYTTVVVVHGLAWHSGERRHGFEFDGGSPLNRRDIQTPYPTRSRPQRTRRDGQQA